MYFKSEKNHITKLNPICQPTDMIKTENILFYIFSIGIKNKVFGETNQSEHSNNLMSAIMTNSIITDM